MEGFTRTNNGDYTLYDRDEAELVRMGKRQMLKMLMARTAKIWPSQYDRFLVYAHVYLGGNAYVNKNLVFGLQNGGPAGLIFSFLVAWIGNISVFIAMGELSSMFPTAGGQYFWASILAPEGAKRFIGYLIGWLTVVSWTAGVTAQTFFCATLIQAVVTVNDPSYQAQGWQGTLMLWAFLILLVMLTTVFGKLLPTLKVMLLLLHVIGFLGTMISLVYYAPTGHASDIRAREIFTTFFNLGGWSTQTLSFFVGIAGNAIAFLGTDGAIHMSEEITRSSVNVARSMILSIILNGLLGFAILLSVLFSTDDIQSLSEIPGSFPFIQMLANCLHSTGAATAITAIIIFMNFASTIAVMSSSSRMMWSFACDCGLPGWKWLQKVYQPTSIPRNTIFTSAVAAALFAIINIPSTAAFQDITSIMLEGFYLSYLIVLSLLLYRRLRGEIHEPDREAFDAATGPRDGSPYYTWGPWRLSGWLGTCNNIIGVVYLLIIGFFSFWPSSAAVSAKNMNYSSAVLGFVMICSIGWYYVRGKKQFSSPSIEATVEGQSVYPVK